MAAHSWTMAALRISIIMARSPKEQASSWQRFPYSRSCSTGKRWAPRSPYRVGCARAALRRAASPSCTCTTARASTPSRPSPIRTSPTTTARYSSSAPGCAVRIEGRGRRVQRARAGPGAAGDGGHGRGLGRRSRDLPHRQEAPQLRVSAHRGTPAATHEHFRRHRPRARDRRARHARLLLPAGLLLGEHAHHHGQRLRGRGRAVPGLYPRSAPRRPGFRGRLLRHGDVPDRVGPAQRRGVLQRAHEGLHLRADLPRRELEHQPASGGVLDDRTGDRLCGPGGERRARRGLPESHDPRRARRA